MYVYVIEQRVIFNVELHCKCINSISFPGPPPELPFFDRKPRSSIYILVILKYYRIIFFFCACKIMEQKSNIASFLT